MEAKQLMNYLPAPRNIQLYQSPEAFKGILLDFIQKPEIAFKRVFSNLESCQQVFERYVFFIAAIPVVSRFIGEVVFSGAAVLSSLIFALVTYIFSVGFLFLATLLAVRLAVIFDGKIDIDKAAKLVVYSFMPFFLSGIFFLLPPLSIFSLAGLYSLYLFYVGIKAVSGIKKHKLTAYYMLNVVSWLVLASVFKELL